MGLFVDPEHKASGRLEFSFKNRFSLKRDPPQFPRFVNHVHRAEPLQKGTDRSGVKRAVRRASRS